MNINNTACNDMNHALLFEASTSHAYTKRNRPFSRFFYVHISVISQV